MSTHTQTSRRVRVEHEAARRRLLDHGVSFLIEDGWRNPFSIDPLRPTYRGRPYPLGKQIAAQMTENSGVEEVSAMLLLADLQDSARARVAEQVARASALKARRLRAAHEPLAVIAPQSSLPSLPCTIGELEKRCRLPIEEIRGCFRQGRRSAEQQQTRELVEAAVRAMVRHYRMRHPAAGTAQLDQQRAVWKEYAGTKNWGQRDLATFLWAFGDVQNDGLGEVDNGLSGAFSVRRSPHRSKVTPAGKKRPQIMRALADALDVHPNTIRRIAAVEMVTDDSQRVGAISATTQEQA